MFYFRVIFFFRDSVNSDEPPTDYIVTGGVDDLVKVWELQDDHLVLKYNLEGHSLGVVSVAISNNGKRKTAILYVCIGWEENGETNSLCKMYTGGSTKMG